MFLPAKFRLTGLAFRSASIALRSFSRLKFLITLPNTQKKELSFDSSSQFSEVEKEIKNIWANTNVDFRNWDNSIISKSNTLCDVYTSKDPVFLQIGTMEWQRFSPDVDVEVHSSNAANYTRPDYSQNLNAILAIIEEYSANTSSRLSQKEKEEIAFTLTQIKSYSNLHVNQETLGKFKNLSDVFETYFKLKSEYAKMNQIKDKLSVKCRFKSRLFIAMGCVLFLLEIILVNWFVYSKISHEKTDKLWLIIACGNLIFLMLYSKKFSGMSAYDFYMKKFLDSALTHHGFSISKLDEAKQGIASIEKMLNTRI